MPTLQPRSSTLLLIARVVAAIATANLAGCSTPHEEVAATHRSVGQRAGALQTPKAVLVQNGVAPMSMPNPVDSNSPSFWDGSTFVQINSWGGQPRRAVGSSLFDLTAVGDVHYDRVGDGGRWLEAVVQADDGTLYGIYHNELSHPCPGMKLTVTQIGYVRSHDKGANWDDFGIILQTRTKPLECERANEEFSQFSNAPPGFVDGVGDPNLVLDREHNQLYFYFGEYGGDVSEQGVSVARMDWSNRDNPYGNVWKYYGGDFTQPGLGGPSTPIFPAFIPEQDPNASMYWGPSIHWNTYLNQWVMVVNKSKDAEFGEEGVYISYSTDIGNPMAWSSPVNLLQGGNWYGLVVGTEPGVGTDKVAGQVARFFNGGDSNWEIHFSFADTNSATFGPGALDLSTNQSVQITGEMLVLQGDGNLVIYDGNGAAVWASGSTGESCDGPGCRAIFQGDGNLVLYNGGRAYWASASNGKGGTSLLFSNSAPYLQILTDAGNAIWASGPGGGGPKPPPGSPPPAGGASQSFPLGGLSLVTGQSVQTSGYLLVLQGDGNFVIYSPSGSPVWNSRTPNQNCDGYRCLAVFQGDGNLVLYNSGVPYWWSGTNGRGAASLRFQTVAPYLQILSGGGSPIWNSQ